MTYRIYYKPAGSAEDVFPQVFETRKQVEEELEILIRIYDCQIDFRIVEEQ